MTDARRDAIVAMALAEVGHPDVAKYMVSAGLPADSKVDWCGIFCLACLHAANVATDVKWRIGLGFIYPEHLPQTKDPQPGDIGYYDQPFQHQDLVVSLKDGVLKTVDGNSPGVKVSERPVPKNAVFYSIEPFLKVATSRVVATSVDDLLRGIDVSRYQDPSHVDYDKLAKTHRFVIVRGAYGNRIDETCSEHVRRARDAGLKTGLYSFYRANQSVAEHLDVFSEVAAAVGMGEGWLPPAIDVEQNPQYDGPVSPALYVPARELVEGLRDRWGAAMVYTNPSMWAEIGSPEWIKEHLLWISHYGVQYPTTPFSMAFTIWQHRVGALPSIAPGQLDQDIARSLPVLKDHDPAAPLMLAVDWQQFEADRDAEVQGEDA